ncbi:MAG: aromatic amino acid ammonia-lyase [Synergistaceae bacterium]|nr:aromatic amino acid ammonia-lyase [Synergistaceae bacterium]
MFLELPTGSDYADAEMTEPRFPEGHGREKLSCNRASIVTEAVPGEDVSLDVLVAVARHDVRVSFNSACRERVERSRALTERFIREKRVIYGVTTGVGENVRRIISEDEAGRYQENILLTHCTSVGEPLDREAVRATMFVMLLNMGAGYSGVRMETLEKLAAMLNRDVVPWAPSHGSVGYLAIEAHIALVLTGRGKAWFGGELLDGGEAMKRAGIRPVVPTHREGLCLISGCTSITALGALAACDARNLVSTADVIAACTLEVLHANLSSFDERVMSAKRQPEQQRIARHILKILNGSADHGERNLQDALSLRCVPQAHGAARRTIEDAVSVLENELHSCNDNPIIHPSGEVISACNADAGFTGIESDSLCIAMGYLSKISERRTDRLLNEYVSGLPPFLTPDPGSNSGYMELQNSSAGLMGEIRVLSHPASVDSIPTCALQEDYVSMGYNAARKARQVVELAEYVLGNELLAAVQAAEFRSGEDAPSPVTAAIAAAVREKAPFMKNDHYIAPDMEWAHTLVHSGRIRAIAEKIIGPMF